MWDQVLVNLDVGSFIPSILHDVGSYKICFEQCISLLDLKIRCFELNEEM